jgi:cellulose synthase/poly-beta-1,6-N-acetylglucosamine synthase-like glycosyltransferase
MVLLYWYIDVILFIAFSLWVMYVLLFALASKRKMTFTYPKAERKTRFAVLFPAYREDNVIIQSVLHFKNQQYPSACYKIVVISDQMDPKTDAQLSDLGALILHPNYVKRSKAAALRLAMSKLDSSNFDAVVIMDADNLASSTFLDHLNDAFVNGIISVQAHRVAKEIVTTTALLDGVSEEINNSIFRRGHVQLGLPSALIGSGMAFEFNWFNTRVQDIDSTGEDKLLEYYLLLDRIHTVYLEDVYVLDEKIQNTGDFSNQRRRWIASQIDAFKLAIKKFGAAIAEGNWPLIDKIFQWSMPPRIIMLGLIPLFMVFSMFSPVVLSYKWIILLTSYMLALALAIPARLYTKELLYAFFSLPRLFFAMLRSILYFRSGRTTFIHTTHGIKKQKENNIN